jgi:hypothetical protein
MSRTLHHNRNGRVFLRVASNRISIRFIRIIMRAKLEGSVAGRFSTAQKTGSMYILMDLKGPG